jgi:hypothetical protein
VSEADHRAGVTALLTANRRQLSLGLREFRDAPTHLKTAFAFDRDFNEQGFETVPSPPPA